MSAGLVSGEASLLGLQTTISSLCLPWTIAFSSKFTLSQKLWLVSCSSNESSLCLFHNFCTCCCLSEKCLPWLFALLALSHHPTVSPNGTSWRRGLYHFHCPSHPLMELCLASSKAGNEAEDRGLRKPNETLSFNFIPTEKIHTSLSLALTLASIGFSSELQWVSSTSSNELQPQACKHKAVPEKSQLRHPQEIQKARSGCPGTSCTFSSGAHCTSPLCL